MKKIADYARMVDSATLPKTIELSATPYAVLRALFINIQKPEDEANLERVNEGLRMMKLLYEQACSGKDILSSRPVFQDIDRYEKAMLRVADDYLNYLEDLEKEEIIKINLPLLDGKGFKPVDGLLIQNPRSFLLKEWSHRDVFNSPSGKGFSFLLSNYGGRRFIIGVDPEVGVNLKGLGSLLNKKESQKRERTGRPITERWYEGNCPFFNYRIIDSPRDGPSLTHLEVRETIFDFSEQFKS